MESILKFINIEPPPTDIYITKPGWFGSEESCTEAKDMLLDRRVKKILVLPYAETQWMAIQTSPDELEVLYINPFDQWSQFLPVVKAFLIQYKLHLGIWKHQRTSPTWQTSFGAHNSSLIALHNIRTHFHHKPGSIEQPVSCFCNPTTL
jgi:hypothetical protein